MLRVMAWVIRWIQMVRQSVNEGNPNFDRNLSIDTLSLEELKVVELKIIQAYHNIYFESEIKILKRITNHKMLKTVDSCGILRVGGRLEKSTLDERVTYSIIVPKSGKVTEF